MDKTEELIERVLNGEETENVPLIILARYVANIIDGRKTMFQLLKESNETEMALILCKLVGEDCDKCPATKLCGKDGNGFAKLLGMSKAECLDFYEVEND